jgi:hypothetical protein
MGNQRLFERRETMKKYSWIFALILALTMAFVFTACPSEPDDTTTTQNPPPGPPAPPPPGPPAPPPNENAPLVAVTFTEDENINKHTGTLSILDDGSGYTYTYVGSSVYGNGAVRFKVDLGEFRLSDYGGISFNWTGIAGDAGLSPADPAYTKNVFLLASADEEGLSGFLGEDGAIKNLIVSTTFFNATKGKDDPKLYTGHSSIPAVKGKNPAVPVHVGMPIAADNAQDFTGVIWLSIYLHAADGSYSVSDVELVPAADFEADFPPPPSVAPPPPPPEEFPDGAVTFDLDLSKNDTVGTTSVNGGTVPEESKTLADGVLTATFTAGGERLILDLTDDQVAMLKTQKQGDKVYVFIDGEVTDGTGNEFRYHIGDASAGSAWNGTNGSNDVVTGGGYKPLADIAFLELSFSANITQDGRLNSLIIQHNGTESVTIAISKITIGVMPPAINTWFFVDLNDANWADTTDSGAGINDTLPTGGFADGVLTLDFSENNQRANFKLSDAQRTALANSFAKSAPGLGNSVKFTIVGSVKSGTGDSFRYHIGDITNGGGWNATSGTGPAAFSTILTGSQTYAANFGAAHGNDGNAIDVTNDPNYFILQTRNTQAITLEITSIKIEFTGVGGEITGEAPPPPPSDYIVDLTAATNSLTSDTLTGQYSGYAVLFPVLTGFDISGYTKLTITASFEDYDGNELVPNNFAGVKIGPSSNGQNSGTWSTTNYIDKSNLGNQTADMALTVTQKSDLAAIATEGWGVWLQKNDSATSGTGVAKITLTGVKFHN